MMEGKLWDLDSILNHSYIRMCDRHQAVTLSIENPEGQFLHPKSNDYYSDELTENGVSQIISIFQGVRREDKPEYVREMLSENQQKNETENQNELKRNVQKIGGDKCCQILRGVLKATQTERLRKIEDELGREVNERKSKKYFFEMMTKIKLKNLSRQQVDSFFRLLESVRQKKVCKLHGKSQNFLEKLSQDIQNVMDSAKEMLLADQEDLRRVVKKGYGIQGADCHQKTRIQIKETLIAMTNIFKQQRLEINL